MNLANQNKIISQRKIWKAFLFAFFVVLSFSFFSGVAHAGNCWCTNNAGLPTNDNGDWTNRDVVKDKFSSDSETACEASCKLAGSNRYCFNSIITGVDLVDSICIVDHVVGHQLGNVTQTADTLIAAATGTTVAQPGECSVGNTGSNILNGDFLEAMKCVLYGVLQGMGWILSLVATLFQWVIEPANVSGDAGLLRQQTVKDVWIMVRDTLNLTFIMILLFAAFCTVFQVESWNLKKVWLNILINALLVNFSFPIARIFIDISNVAMYYFLNNLFSGTGGGSGSAIITSFSHQAQLSTLLTPDGYANASVTYMLAGIVFTFIMGVTLLVLAVLFVIRLVALTMLLMFSPIGFVGYIFPGTSKFASQWWENLFKYAFFGPVMVFMMMVAMAIMKATPQTFTKAATGNVLIAADAGWIGSAAFFSIPIIILWIAMGISQSMGVAGASAVVGAGKKWGGKAAMLMSGGKFAKDTFGAYQTRRKQGDAEKTSNRLGKFLGNQQDHLIGSNLSLTKRGRQHANQRYQADEAAEVAAAAKLHDTANMDPGQLKKLAGSKDRFDRAAAHLELAAKGKTEGTEELDKTRNDFGADSQVFKQLQNKVKAYDPVAAYAHLSEKDQRNKWKDHVTSNQFEAKKVKENSLNADFLEVAMENGGMTAEDLLELTKKPGNYAEKIKGSMKKIVGSGKHNDTTKNQFDRNIQLAYAAATGKIYEKLDESQSAEIIKRLNKDNANLEKEVFAGAGGLAFIKHVNTSKFKEIFENLKKEGSPVALLEALKEAQKSDDKETQLKANQLIAQMKKDPSMRVKFEDIGGKFPEKDKEKKRKEKNDENSDKKTNNPVGFQF